MVPLIRHAVVSKYHERCLVVHQLHDFVDQVFSIQQFALDFRVPTVEGVACAINADNVTHHKVKIASRFQLLNKTFAHTSVECVKVAEIQTVELFISIEVLAKHGTPDVVTVKGDCRLRAARLFELVKDVVFGDFFGPELAQCLGHCR